MSENLDKLEIEKKAIAYINKNKKIFLEKSTRGIEAQNEKIAIFTAGMSGVGKTEFGIFLKETNPNLLHIDTDMIRDFFKPVGYDGNNADLFQKPASKGFSKLFDYAIKREVVTKRKVPYDIFVKSDINSYKTVIELKNIFKDDIILHYIDKKNDLTYENIDSDFLKSQIGGYFEI
jgi:hypothetical protein